MAGTASDFTERIKNNLDIVDLVADYVDLKKVGKNYQGLCPFHQEDTPSFTVNPDRQLYYCFGCGEGGDLFNFIMEIENITFRESMKLLARRAGLEIPQQSENQKRVNKKRERIFTLNNLAARFYHYLLLKKDIGQKALNYLQDRGFTTDDIEKFKLGYAPDRWNALGNFLQKKGYKPEELEEAGLLSTTGNGSYYDRFRNRVIFPIFNTREEVIAFGGRIMPGGAAESPKYLNSPDTIIFKKSNCLYGINWARRRFRDEDRALIMEGYTDVLSAHRAGLTEAVASLGTSLTVRQAKILDRYVSTVYISYDSDPAGNKATMRGLEILDKVGLQVKVIKLPEDTDPDDFINKFGRESFIAKIEEAEGLLDYKINRILGGHDLTDPDTRIIITRKLIKLLEGVSDSITREVYLQKIAEKLNIDSDLLKRQVKIVRKKDKNYKNSYTKNTDSSINIVGRKVLKAFIDNIELRDIIIEKLAPDCFPGEYQEIAKFLWANKDSTVDNMINAATGERLYKRLMELTVAEEWEVDLSRLKSWIDRLLVDREIAEKEELYRQIKDREEFTPGSLNRLLLEFQAQAAEMRERRDFNG